MSQLLNVLDPIQHAHGLPNACYINDDMYKSEQQQIFADGWAAIGFGIDVPDPGCVKPLEFLGIPLLLTRTRDNVVKVFENVCRHRGMILVEKAARLNGPITCPYHAWSYDLEGQLRSTPHVGGPDIHEHHDIVCGSLSLSEVSSVVWRDVIFINLSGTAPPFDIVAEDLQARWSEFDKPLHFSGDDSLFSLMLDCNWKLAVENYCEAYHIPFIHPGLNSYSRLEDHYNILSHDSFAGQGSYVYNPQISDDGRGFPSFEGLSEKWDTAAEYCAFFPNVLFGVHKDHAYAILLIPNAQNKTTEHVAIYYADEQACDDSYADMRAKNTAMWKDIFIEDIIVVEGMQKGRNAPSYDGGKFSPVMDCPTHHFHKWVASALLAKQNGPKTLGRD